MNLEILQQEKIKAMKNKDNFKKQVLSNMIDIIQKASITSKGRIEITEQMVDNNLMKYQKMVQEMIDTCPENRTDKMEEYNKTMEIVKKYTPQLLADEQEIKSELLNILYFNENIPDLLMSNKGKIMKIISPLVKGKMDMKTVNKVIDDILKEKNK